MFTFINPEEPQALARVLIDLADNKRDVQTTTDHRTLSFRVPDYLRERWKRYQNLDATPPETPEARKTRSK